MVLIFKLGLKVMTDIKILFVEDKESDIESMNDTLVRFNAENSTNIIIDIVHNKQEFYEKKLYYYDAVICDLKIPEVPDNSSTIGTLGNDILRDIQSESFNIPVYIITGTTDNVECEEVCYLDIRTKGDSNVYYETLKDILSLHNTGIIPIIGARGFLQRHIKDIYTQYLKPQIKEGTWNRYNLNGKDTQNILVRYVSSILQAKLSNFCKAVSEEMYIIPSPHDNITTGTILKKNEDFYVVLNPECDLVIRNNGLPKTDFVLICKLNYDYTIFNRENKNKLKNYNLFHAYFLPQNSIFPKGYLNFRNIQSIPYDNIRDNYEIKGQITGCFTKEIVQKFSSYYSRQGQPDLYEDATDLS